ncbi:hypothetical protein GGS21DRAFT_542409 [Xylaria nigripes]|nr:hypothetical protein GGS21DRAFT_542409 [Xylaria nigripes]
MRHHPYNRRQRNGGGDHPHGDSNDVHPGPNPNYKGKHYDPNYRANRYPGSNRNHRQDNTHINFIEDNSISGFPQSHSNYKGRNYDPNYRGRRNQNPNYIPQNNNNHQNHRRNINSRNHHHQNINQIFLEDVPQQNQQGRNPNRNPFSQPRPPKAPHYDQIHQNSPPNMHANRRWPQQQQQQQQLSSRSQFQEQIWAQLRQEVLRMLEIDADGDIFMCSCQFAGTPDCYHGILSQYQKRLVLSTRLQHDIARFIFYLASKAPDSPEAVRTWAKEFVEGNPGTPLQSILEAIFRPGSAVQLGALGLGIDFLIDDMRDANGIF